jgi:5-formyltetrahydrofolate cyclo-ligase
MTKKEARSVFLQKRNALSEGELFEFNQKIYFHFFAHLDLSFVKVVHLFLSIESKKEPDTWGILDRLRREFPHIRLAIPKMREDGVLEHYFFEGMQQLKVNAWGIAEPLQGIPVEVKKIDLVLVPLLAVDKGGNRVGYGKGYYDQFLVQCRQDCKKIGLSFFEPIDTLQDVAEWDVALNQCITPGGIISF